MRRRFAVENGLMAGLASLCLAGVLTPAWAQSTAPSTPPAQSDNPFPGQAQTPAPAKTQPGKPEAKPAQSDNPFPGEDPNAPIIPVDPGAGSGRENGPGSGAGSGPDRSNGDAGSAGAARRDADPDGDPVRTPDPPGQTDNDGFSSSRSGLPSSLPVEDDSDARPGKSTKNKTREQVIQEDLDVGSFYLTKGDWKAAQLRYAAAFGLDNENPNALWGLAEAERHQRLYKEAAAHYLLFLTYDPDGPHGRAARKGLEEVESAQASAGGGAKNGGSAGVQPK